MIIYQRLAFPGRKSETRNLVLSGCRAGRGNIYINFFPFSSAEKTAVIQCSRNNRHDYQRRDRPN